MVTSQPVLMDVDGVLGAGEDDAVKVAKVDGVEYEGVGTAVRLVDPEVFEAVDAVAVGEGEAEPVAQGKTVGCVFWAFSMLSARAVS